MRITKWIPSAMGALALAALAVMGTSASAQTITTNQLSFTDFETALPWNPYTYVYPGNTEPNPAPALVQAYLDYHLSDVDRTNRMLIFTLDTSAIEWWFMMYPGLTFGSGFGGPLNWNKDLTLFTTNRADYLLSFDVKAEGLTNGASSIGGEFQFRFVTPDGTMGGALDNNADTILQVNKGFSVGSNSTHFEYTLDNAGIGGGSEEDFAAFLSAVNELQFNVNLHMPSDRLAFDADNSIYLDNVKLSIIIRSNVPPPPPLTEFTIANWTWDAQPWRYTYGYTYCEHQYAITNRTAFETGQGVGGSDVLVARFLTDWIGQQTPRPGWAGAGLGGGGPIDRSLINTTNLAGYKLYFDGRVEGLTQGRTQTGMEMQFQIQVPDNTLQPPDSNTDPETIISLHSSFNLKSNWQTFSYTFDRATIGGGSFANFVTYFDLISSLNANSQVTGLAGDYGFDTDNAFFLDNIKLVRLVVGLPPLNVSVAGGSATVTWGAWTGVGQAQLQTAPAITGPWGNVTGGTSSPQVVPAGGDAKFFRLLWVPPAP